MSESPREVTIWERQRTLWRDNHVGLILAVMLVIFLVGASVLVYRDSRFRPPRFPNARSIQSPGKASVVIASGDSIPASEAVTIRVSGAANSNGPMLLAIYAAEAGFNDPAQAIARVRHDIVDGESEFVLRAKDLPAKIAIAAFHDENKDGELNRNAIGIPMERYGFSNAARSVIGPPTFAECVIDRPKTGVVDVFIR